MPDTQHDSTNPPTPQPYYRDPAYNDFIYTDEAQALYHEADVEVNAIRLAAEREVDDCRRAFERRIEAAFRLWQKARADGN